jgi:hypothetical protein
VTADTPTDLLTGVAELLHAAGVGNWAGDSAPVVSAGGLPGIVLRQLPSQPAFVLCMFDYRVGADARLTDSMIGINVRVRSDTGPSRASMVLQQVFLQLHALGRYRLGAGTDHELRVTDIQWQSESPIGPDTSGRHERSANYYALLNQPGTTRE